MPKNRFWKKWKLKSIKWWLQIPILMLSFFLAFLAKWKSASFHLAPLCAKTKLFSHKAKLTDGENLVKLKTYKSFASCSWNRKNCLVGAGICLIQNNSSRRQLNEKNLFKHLKTFDAWIFTLKILFHFLFFTFTFGGFKQKRLCVLLAFKIKLISKLNKPDKNVLFVV